MNDIKVICFDYYNTLTEVKEPFLLIKQWFNTYIKNQGKSIDSERLYSRFLRYRAVAETSIEFMTGIELLTSCIKWACEFYNFQSFDKEIRAFIEDLFRHPQTFADVQEVLQQLRKKYKIGLLTNADNYLLYYSLKEQHLEFDFVVSSEDAKANKPDQKIFLHAINKLKVKPENILMVGDSLFEDIYGAANCGFQTVWLNRDNNNLREGLVTPDYIIRNLDELTEILRREKDNV